MSFSYRPAVLDKTSVLIGLAGPTGCGKTYSALRLATGLAGPTGKIGFVDTEAGRGLHYARYFKFHHGILRPPFSPDSYTAAVEAYEHDGFDVIIVDSMTHEYSGEGGLQEWAERLETGVPKPDVEYPDAWKREHWIIQPVKAPGNWNEPKTEHKKMVNRFLQCRAHLIFCLRAEEKIKIEKVNGKTVVVPAGWKPITEKNFMFEMTASFMLSDSVPGIPTPIKLQDQHAVAFPAGEMVSEESGKQLAVWARGTAPPAQTSNAKTIPLVGADGTIHVFPRAAEWLTGLHAQIEIGGVDVANLQKMWDANMDVFYRIESAARARGDVEMMNSIGTVGKYAMERLGITGTDSGETV